MLSVYSGFAQSYTGLTTPSLSSAGGELAGTDTTVSKQAAITPFAAMAEQRKSVADQIAGVITGVLGAVGVEINASGSGVQVSRPAQMPKDIYSVGQPKPFYENPLFVGGAFVLVAVLLLRK